MALATVLLALLLFSPRIELAVTLAVVGIALTLSWALLRYQHVWFDPGLPIMAIALVKPAWAWRRSEMVLFFLRQGVNSLGHPGHHLPKLPVVPPLPNCRVPALMVVVPV
jgi:hypothetical protein